MEASYWYILFKSIFFLLFPIQRKCEEEIIKTNYNSAKNAWFPLR